ncbi:MAG: non-homologous end-joining DNA ligase [Candidatus Methanomethylicus sp.]|nr:non-homologous end-joining DNA ligase [Candidatus Methanomethylicus sp.]
MRAFYKPMLAQPAEAPFSSPDWLYEIKWDGIRAISYVGKGKGSLSIRSRNGSELKQSFPELDELENLAKDVVIDGEIVVMVDGKADFQAVLERIKASRSFDINYLSRQMPATYIVFDLLEADGRPTIGLPLVERLKLMRERLREGDHVVLSRPVDGKGEDYYAAASAKGIEGIVAKRKDSSYEPGHRSGDWLKIKREKTADCIILGYSKGGGARGDTFGALLLGLYDVNRKLIFAGKVGTGFSDMDLAMLAGKFRRLQEGAIPTEGAATSGEEITWLRPELVCEVVYQMVTKDGKLRMPRFRGLREDKIPEECTVDQLHPKVLEKYRSKRRFERTPEPAGRGEEQGLMDTIVNNKMGEAGRMASSSTAKQANGENLSFVVHEHHSKRFHFDLRLERDGVLKSWAVPKGMPIEPGEKRLAIQVEDHPVEYGSFEGTIPEGEYGAGDVIIWERGTYRTLEWKDDKIEIIMEGEKGRVSGRYALVRFKRAGQNQWLVFKAGE